MKLPESPHLRLFLRRLVLGLVLAALFAWLALRPRAGGDERLVEREYLAMGTLVSVSLYLDAGSGRSAAEAALDEAGAFLTRYEQTWRAWGDGELAALNRRLAAGEAIDIPPQMQPLFARAAALGRASGGRFDVRIGRLVELWGFHDDTRIPAEPPAAEALAAQLAALAGAPPLDAEPQRYGPAPMVWFDFGAIAKGDAIDRLAAQLQNTGYRNFIINAGGNLRTAGSRGERAWRIGIRHPRPGANSRLLATLETRGEEAVITSGDYERRFEFEGRRYHHLLDPRSGYPAQGLQAVSVVAGSGALADAASTALFVAGPRDWPEVARAMGIDRAFAVDAQGRVSLSGALSGRLRLAEGVPVTTPP